MLDVARGVATSDATRLLTGETGRGTSFLGRLIHGAGGRSVGLFAGKLHALLARSYPKGREWLDLAW
ncbi:MAG: hypothetical protein HY900_27275 [Deltaproteobacteria bacterium]|nr:hypothetical protein [Deltaproteobacteria bacterium]